MIIFDRFLCCISLKTFGKTIGWIGLMTSLCVAYAIFLVISAKATSVYDVKQRYFGSQITTDGFNLLLLIFYFSSYFKIKISEAYYYSASAIGALLLFALIHVSIICGIKFVSIRHSAKKIYDVNECFCRLNLSPFCLICCFQS
jgi:hypothetical protein